MRLAVGQVLELRTASRFYRGPYLARVMEVGEEYVTVTIPYDRGRIVILGTGTPVEVSSPEEEWSFCSEVVGRSFGVPPAMRLELPYEATGSRCRNGRVVAVCSGKGGVGKTLVALSTAAALAERGFKVLAMDADFCAASMDTMLRLCAPLNLTHFLQRRFSLEDVMIEVSARLWMLPGGAVGGVDHFGLQRAVNSLWRLTAAYDFIVVDTSTGIFPHTLKFLVAADDILVITTPSPLALRGTKEVMRHLATSQLLDRVTLVVNRVSCRAEYQRIVDDISGIALARLGGFIPEDPYADKAIKKCIFPYLAYPHCPFARGIRLATQFLLDIKPSRVNSAGPNCLQNRVSAPVKNTPYKQGHTNNPG